MRYCVYEAVHTDTGHILYIGCTSNLKVRAAAHRGTAWWCRGFPDRVIFRVIVGDLDEDLAFQLEAAFIGRVTPIGNWSNNSLDRENVPA